MAGQADGSIIVDTEIDPEGFKAGSAELQRAVKSLTTSVNNLGPTFQKALAGNESAITSFEAKAATLKDRISEIEKQMEALGTKVVPTEQYAKLSAELDQAEAKFDQLLDKQEKMQALGVSEESQSWRSLQYDIEQCSEKIHALRAEKEQLEASGKAIQLGSATTEYRQLENDLNSARTQLGVMQSRVEEVRNGMGGTASYAGAVSSHLGTAAKHASGKLVYGIRQAASHMWSIVTHGKSANKQFAGLISRAKRFAISLLGARGVYALLQKAVSAYMAENQQFSNTMSSCWSGIGNILGPVITRVINLVATAVAYVQQFLGLFGIFGKTAAKEISAAGGAAGSEAKKLEKQLASFDELNILQNNDSGGGGGGGAGSAEAPAVDVELPDWAKLMAEQMKAGAWGDAGKTLANALNDMVDNIDWAGWGSRLGKGIQNGISFALNFARTFDWQGLGSDIATFLNNTIDNIDPNDLGALLAQKIRIAVEFAYGFVTTFDWSGNGQWLGEVVNGWINEIDWSKTGETIGKAISGAITFGIEFLKTIDWEEAKKALGDLIVSFWEGLGENQGMFLGIAAAIAAWKLGPSIISGFSQLISGLSATGSGAESAAGAAGTAAEAVGGTGGGGLSGKLLSLAKNLGLGIGIIAEVGIAVGLFVGEIWLLGKGLEQVGIAWQPVIDNGSTIALAMTIGLGMLAAIGAVTALLGSVGAPLIINLGLGIAILAEIGIAAGLFLAEIWGVGKGLVEIGKAWQPVLDNGEIIATGIGIGTGLLIGIGVVTAALGAATVASAGLLPVAIGLGTAILVELAVAFVAFTESLVAVANELKDRLAPSLAALMVVMPELSTNMGSFVDFMEEFAGHVVRYTKANGISALSGTIDTIIGWFTQDPIQKLANDVKKTYTQTKDLHDNLDLAVPELKAASELLSDYQKYIDEIARLTNTDNSPLGSNMLVNMKEVGKNLVTGFAEGMDSESGRLETSFGSMEKLTESTKKNILSTLDKLVKDAKAKLDQMKTNVSNAWKAISDDTVKKWDSVRQTVSSKLTGKGGLAETITAGLNSAKSKASIGASGIASAITNALSYFPAYTWGAHIAQNMAAGMDDNAWRVRNSSKGIAQFVHDYLHFSEPDVGPLSDFHTYMPDMMKLMAKGIDDNRPTVIKSVSGVATAISEEFSSGEYSIKPLVSEPQIDGTLGRFSDRIADSFSALLNRLQAIADGVTFRTPAAANGLVPYRTAAAAAGSGADVSSVIEAGNEELIGVLNQLALMIVNAVVPAIDRNGNPIITIDRDTIARMAIEGINQQTRRDGKSPLL